MTIQVNGREYDYEVREDHEQGRYYVLRGKRGAEYRTLRNARTPHMMFLIHQSRGFGIPAGFEGVWFTDQNGKLEVVR